MRTKASLAIRHTLVTWPGGANTHTLDPNTRSSAQKVHTLLGIASRPKVVGWSSDRRRNVAAQTRLSQLLQCSYNWNKVEFECDCEVFVLLWPSLVELLRKRKRHERMTRHAGRTDCCWVNSYVFAGWFGAECPGRKWNADNFLFP